MNPPGGEGRAHAPLPTLRSRVKLCSGAAGSSSFLTLAPGRGGGGGSLASPLSTSIASAPSPSASHLCGAHRWTSEPSPHAALPPDCGHPSRGQGVGTLRPGGLNLASRFNHALSRLRLVPDLDRARSIQVRVQDVGMGSSITCDHPGSKLPAAQPTRHGTAGHGAASVQGGCLPRPPGGRGRRRRRGIGSVDAHVAVRARGARRRAAAVPLPHQPRELCRLRQPLPLCGAPARTSPDAAAGQRPPTPHLPGGGHPIIRTQSTHHALLSAAGVQGCAL